MPRRRLLPAMAVPEPIANPRDAAMSRRLERLAAVPATPRSLQHPRNWVAGARLFVDYSLTVPRIASRFASKIRHYPEPFVKRFVEARDGTRLAAWFGVHEGERRPALIIVPGLFTSKDNYVVKQRAVRIFHEWGFHVMTMDLRGNGESARVPSTPGWKEADDLVDAASEFRRRADIDGLGVYAESLAANAAVVAAGRTERTEEPFADRGVIAVSPAPDIPRTLALYSDPPKDNPELRQTVNFFNLLLRLSGWPARTFAQYHELGSRHYGVDAPEKARQSSLYEAASRLREPVLILHSEDDTLVPVEQAQRLLPVAATADNVAVWLLPWGNHTLYEMAEPNWFWNVLAAWLDATPGPYDAARDGQTSLRAAVSAETPA